MATRGHEGSAARRAAQDTAIRARSYSRIGWPYFGREREREAPTEEDWQRIERTLGLTAPDHAIRAEIEDQVGWYLAEGAPLGRTPQYVRPTAVTKRLRAVGRAARDLHRVLACDQGGDRERQEARGALWRLQAELGGLVAVNVLPQLLGALDAGVRAAVAAMAIEAVAAMAIEGPRSAQGRRSNRGFEYLVARLKDLFERVTESRVVVDQAAIDRFEIGAGAGFLDFVDAVTAHLPGGTELRKTALAWAVQRALRHQRARERRPRAEKTHA
jgi:hypothetical protein